MFQEINFTVQKIWILSWCIKRQNIAGLCQQTFYLCSADSFSWSCFASCWIGAKIIITSKLLYGEVIPWNGTSGDLPLWQKNEGSYLSCVMNGEFYFNSWRISFGWSTKISGTNYNQIDQCNFTSWTHGFGKNTKSSFNGTC